MKHVNPVYLRIIIAIGGLAVLVGRQFLPGGSGLDIQAILASTDLANLLEAAGLGAIFSQLFKRAGDLTPKQAEAVAEARSSQAPQL